MPGRWKLAGCAAWIWIDLLLHDLVMKTFGFQAAYRRLEKTRTRPRPSKAVSDAFLLGAVDWATTLYPKNVMCLQRSFVTARIFRRCGIAANVVIGYRAAPFFSHAWVEAGGRVINDQPAYRRQLTILLRSDGGNAGAVGG